MLKFNSKYGENCIFFSQYYYYLLLSERYLFSRIDHSQKWNQTPILTGLLHEYRKTQNRGSIGLVSLRLFILNLPRRGGNRGTSLPCNFRSFSPLVVSPSRRIPLAPTSPLFSTPVVTACSNTSVRHPPLFTTSKRRRCFFPLWCAKNFIRSLSNPSRRLVYEIRWRS